MPIRTGSRVTKSTSTRAGPKRSTSVSRLRSGDTLVANACLPDAGFQVLTEQMKEIIFVEPAFMDGTSHVRVVRATLRQLLLDGLEDVVKFGKVFTHYEQTSNGKLTAIFDDGTTAVGDVLVGADGTSSKVRNQLLPRAQIIDTGIVGAACRLPISHNRRRQLPERLLTRLTSIIPPRRSYMIVTQSLYGSDAKYLDPVGDHLIWVLVSSRAAYGDANPTAMDGESIRWVALGMTKDWHPVLRSLIADSDPKDTSAVPVLTSISTKLWASTNVTLLGDAIHTMTPFQGLGGSTALRDAGLLLRELIEVNSGADTPIGAINLYEKAMVTYGFAAVRRSARFGHIVASENWLLRTAFKAALRIASRVPALKNSAFRRSLELLD